MPRVTFVKSARKAVPRAGIEVGDSYYWWKFRYGGKQYSKTRPRSSQLTQSEFLGEIYALQESIEDLTLDDAPFEDFVKETADRLREIANECEEKRYNMPDALQDGDTGQLLEARAEACNNAADELEAIDLSEFDEDEAREELEDDEVDEDDEIDDSIEDRLDEKRREYYEEQLEQIQTVTIDA
jgi:hypothetical protein